MKPSRNIKQSITAGKETLTTTQQQKQNPKLEDCSRFRHNRYASQVFVIDNKRVCLP